MTKLHSSLAFSRRRLLSLGGGLLASSALAGLLTACGQSAASPTAAPTTAAAPTSAATSAPTTAATAAGASPSAAATTAPTAAATTAATAASASPAATAATSATPAAAAAPVSTGPVSLRVAPGSTATSWKGVWPDLIKAYQTAHSNVTIAIDSAASGANYDQKLFAEIAAGTLPDVIYTTDNYAVPFKQNKITQDMLPYARQTNFPVNDFNKTFLNLGMVDGTLQMLPVSGDVVILFINKKLVQQAGVEIPWTLDYKDIKKWTTDDFYKVCQKLTVDVKGKRGDEPGFDKTNVSTYGAAMPIDWWAMYVPALLSFGGQLVSDDLTRSMLNSKAGVDAFTWLTKPVLDGYWAPYSYLSPFGPTTNAQATGAFNASKAAITATVRGAIPGIRPNIKDDWDVANFYAGPVKRVTGMGTQGFALSGSTKQPNDAWAFLEFMYGADGMKIITSSYGATPVEQRFYNSSFWKDLPPPPANNNVFTQAYDYGTLPPRLPFYTTGPFTKALLDGLQAIELGQSTPTQVVASVSNQLQQWLDQNKKQ